jgi:hypothetical protein
MRCLLNSTSLNKRVVPETALYCIWTRLCAWTERTVFHKKRARPWMWTTLINKELIAYDHANSALRNCPNLNSFSMIIYFFKERKCAYEIAVLFLYFLTLWVLNPMADYHEIWYAYYATGDHPRTSNSNMADAWNCDTGTTLAQLSIRSRNDSLHGDRTSTVVHLLWRQFC